MLQIQGYVTVKEAARIIGCTDNWVRQLLKNGELRGDNISERMTLVQKKSAETYAKKPKIMGRPRVSAIA